MVRSFSNRIFGGVCGGLGNSTPINAWIWRIAFIALSIGTFGLGIALYLLWWWLLPMGSPVRRNTSAGLRGLLTILLTITLVGGLIVRENLTELVGADIFIEGVVLVLAFVLLLKQIFSGRRGNVAIALVAVAVPIVLIAGELGMLTGGAYDLAIRSYPAVLLFLGLALLLRYRMPLGGMVALLLTVAITGGIAYQAYNSRVDNKLSTNTRLITESVSTDVTTLQINVSMLDTDVQVSVAPAISGDITADFEGGDNSDITATYNEEGVLATFVITESYINDVPLLDAVGRAELRLEIPQGVALALDFTGSRGDVTFDMASLDLERLNLALIEGNAVITLPEYQPLSPSVLENPGQWEVLNGNLRVVIPEDVGARFLLERSQNAEPRPSQAYDDLYYALELSPNDYILTSRGYEALEIQVRYRVNVPSGVFQVDTVTE